MPLTFLHDNIGLRQTLVAVTTSGADAETTGYAAGNLLTGNRHTYWQTSSTGNVTFIFDAGTCNVEDANYLLLGRLDRLTALGTTVGVMVRYTTDAATCAGASWTNLATANLTTGSLMAPTFQDWFTTFTSTNARGWQVYIAGTTAGNRQLSALWLGSLTSAPTPSLSGQFGGVRAHQGSRLTLEWRVLSESDRNTVVNVLSTVSPAFPGEIPTKTRFGMPHGGQAHWMYDSGGEITRSTVASLVEVVLMTPGVAEDTVVAPRLYSVGPAEWQQVV